MENNFYTQVSMPLQPFSFQATNEYKIPMMMDNGPRLLQQVDSTMNTRLLKGNYTKRMFISKKDSPVRDYLHSKIDLTHPMIPEKIMIDRMKSQSELEKNIERNRSMNLEKNIVKIPNIATPLEEY